MAKISIFKSSADGEQVNIELELRKDHYEKLAIGESLREQLEPYFRLVDDRLLEMNKRIIASNMLVKQLPVDAQMAVTNVMDVLHGRSMGPPPVKVVDESKREYDEAKANLEAAEAKEATS